MAEKLWSARAWCYKVTQNESRTLLYYKCLDTGKKTKLIGSSKLTVSAYENRTGPLIINE